MGIIDFVQRNWKWLGFLVLTGLVWVLVVNRLLPETPAGDFNVKIVWVCFHIGASVGIALVAISAVVAVKRWLSRSGL